MWRDGHTTKCPAVAEEAEGKMFVYQPRPEIDARYGKAPVCESHSGRWASGMDKPVLYLKIIKMPVNYSVKTLLENCM